jgi:hypothetical protein
LPPPTHAAPSANSYLLALRKELEKQRSSPFTLPSLRPLIEALDRHCAEQDRRIAVLERLLQAPR